MRHKNSRIVVPKIMAVSLAIATILATGTGNVLFASETEDTAQLEETETKEPLESLSLGSHGEEVSAVQEKLVLLGFLAVAPDGDYGSVTQEAVGAFQEAYGLDVSGIMGPVSLFMLNGCVEQLDTSIAEKETDGDETAEDAEENVQGEFVV